MRLFKRIMLTVAVLIITFSGVFLIGNNYQMKEEKVEIPTTAGTLAAVVTAPKSGVAKGVIIFVHGDGPQEATQNGGYKPLMERFAKQGYLSVSWDKLGVGKSTGNWLTQSMLDRQAEVSQVITWMKEQYPEATNKIGLWGASQAGWVIPQVVRRDPNVQFSLLAGPAINWLRQGAYDTGWQVKNNGGTEAEVVQAEADFIADSTLIQENDTFQDYKNNGGKDEMSEDRYGFIRKNMSADVTSDLSKINKPIYLILAEADKNIDSVETKKVYQAEVQPEYLTVKEIPKVEHQMLNPQIANSNLLINLVGIFLPKYFLIDTNYLDFCEQVAAQQ